MVADMSCMPATPGCGRVASKRLTMTVGTERLNAGCDVSCRAAQDKLPYAEEVLVLRSDVDERLQRIVELEHQVSTGALTHIRNSKCSASPQG